jgi:hypothetical protein
MHIFNGAIYAPGYDDFEAVTLFASSDQSIIAMPRRRTNLRQLIAWLKSNSGRDAGRSGQVDILFDQVSSSFPQVRALYMTLWFRHAHRHHRTAMRRSSIHGLMRDAGPTSRARDRTARAANAQAMREPTNREFEKWWPIIKAADIKAK